MDIFVLVYSAKKYVLKISLLFVTVPRAPRIAYRGALPKSGVTKNALLNSKAIKVEQQKPTLSRDQEQQLVSRDRQQQLTLSHNQKQQIASRDRQQQLTESHNQQQIASRDRQQQLTVSLDQQQQLVPRDRLHQLTEPRDQQQQIASRERQLQLTKSRDKQQLIASYDKHKLTSTANAVSAESIEGDIGVVENELTDVDEVDIKQEVESDECQYNHSYSGNINIYKNIFNNQAERHDF